MENYTITKQTSTSMIIEMETANLTITDQKRMFGKEFDCVAIDETLAFIQKEDYIFDINTLLYLGLDPGFRLLEKGTYPLEIHNTKILISITLCAYR
jgi:hypothetical protein